MYNKTVELFCGTGGVGKTTISASRALHLASKGNKVLLITIDPAKRLKQLLNIKSDQTITTFTEGDIKLDVLLLDCQASFNRVIGKEVDNKILQKLSESRGGLNEILATMEIQHQLQKKKYDNIVVDTAPGRNFIDFLEATKKINKFFNKTFAEAFKYIINKNKSGQFFNKILATGIEKILDYLESVTGKGFINNFLEAINILYSNRDAFLEGVKVESTLNNKDVSCWFLVTSAEHMKEVETEEIIKEIETKTNTDRFLIINKSWLENLKNWEPKDEHMIEFKEVILEQEEKKQELLKKTNTKAITFPDLVENEPIKQLITLKNIWEKLEN